VPATSQQMSRTVTGRRQLPAWAWAILGLLILAGAALLIFAPEEATIGQGIKIVYVHVALIWTGMLGLILTGALGLTLLVSGRPKLYSWMTTLGRVSLIMFAAGVGTSLIAEIVNWGGIAWREPRTAANLNLLAFAAVIQIANSWLSHPRLEGALNTIVAAAVVWTTITTELQLHPDNPIGSSSSGMIQFTFYGLFLVSSLIAVWWVLYLVRPSAAHRDQAAGVE
jgi:hypothetical protein